MTSAKVEGGDIEQYYKLINTTKYTAIEILSHKSDFILTKTNIKKYSVTKINGETLNQKLDLAITSQIYYYETSSNEPRYWYCTCAVPGKVAIVAEIDIDSPQRVAWDESISTHEVIELASDLNIIRATTATLGGGLISPREFLNVIQDFKPSTSAQMRISHAIEEPLKYPLRYGYVRGSNPIYCLWMTPISNLKKYNLPAVLLRTFPETKVKVKRMTNTENVNNSNANECSENEIKQDINDVKVDGKVNSSIMEWTFVEILLQINFGGWIPKMVVDSSTAGGFIVLFNGMTDYLLKKHQIEWK